MFRPICKLESHAIVVLGPITISVFQRKRTWVAAFERLPVVPLLALSHPPPRICGTASGRTVRDRCKRATLTERRYGVLISPGCPESKEIRTAAVQAPMQAPISAFLPASNAQFSLASRT